MDAVELGMRKLYQNVLTEEDGTTAVEFAIVSPVFILLIFGLIYVGLTLFAAGSLHYAVEEGARCAAVRTALCDGATATLTYTKQHYFGLGGSPDFAYATTACGNSVSGSTNYVLDFGITKVTVPLSATACFP